VAVLDKRLCVVVVDSVRVEGLRIQFQVHKGTGKEPNTCEVRIYNLAEKTRSGMQKKYAPVILTAGYEGNAAVIFNGDARTVDHVKQGSEWVTIAKCGDGERAYTFQRISRSFGPGTRIVDVALACADALGLNPGNLREELDKGSFRGGLTEFTNGRVVHGKASAELDKVLRGIGLSWSVQNGEIQVLRGDAPAPGRAVLLSPASGLIGSPEHGSPEKKGKPSPIKARSLLQPQIICGGRVEIQSRSMNGQFAVKKVTHAGDSRGLDWYTDLEALPL
jgi:hypothetical protein